MAITVIYETLWLTLSARLKKAETMESNMKSIIWLYKYFISSFSSEPVWFLNGKAFPYLCFILLILLCSNANALLLLFIFNLNTALTASNWAINKGKHNLYSLVNPFSAIYFLCALFPCEGSCAPSTPSSDNL